MDVIEIVKQLVGLEKFLNSLKRDRQFLRIFKLLIYLLDHFPFISSKILNDFAFLKLLNFLLLIEDLVIVFNQLIIALEPVLRVMSPFLEFRLHGLGFGLLFELCPRGTDFLHLL